MGGALRRAVPWSCSGRGSGWAGLEPYQSGLTGRRALPGENEAEAPSASCGESTRKSSRQSAGACEDQRATVSGAGGVPASSRSPTGPSRLPCWPHRLRTVELGAAEGLGAGSGGQSLTQRGDGLGQGPGRVRRVHPATPPPPPHATSARLSQIARRRRRVPATNPRESCVPAPSRRSGAASAGPAPNHRVG